MKHETCEIHLLILGKLTSYHPFTCPKSSLKGEWKWSKENENHNKYLFFSRIYSQQSENIIITILGEIKQGKMAANVHLKWLFDLLI